MSKSDVKPHIISANIEKLIFNPEELILIKYFSYVLISNHGVPVTLVVSNELFTP